MIKEAGEYELKISVNVLENESDFERLVLQSEVPVLVDFWAPWCDPCHRMASVVSEIAAENQMRLRVFRLNVDDNPRAVHTYSINGIPSFVIFKGGRVVDKILGAVPKQLLNKSIEKACVGR
jgi:thioredoxin 1